MSHDVTEAPSLPVDPERYARNIKDETDGAALYRYLAAAESDERLRGVYERLAETEDRHRAVWEDRLREAGYPVPEFKPSLRIRILGWLAKRFGPDTVAPIAARMESNAYTMYDNQPEAIAHGMHSDERSHARLFREIARLPRGSDIPIAQLEGRHQAASGNAIRAAVLGANDGLVSNLSLVMGFAGASPGADVVLLSGIAGLLAGALSMGLGEWISVKSSAEYYERQVQIERDELELMPEEEKEELVLIYEAKGLSEQEARYMADRAFQDQERALQALVTEELGLGADDGGNPWTAAIVSFITFSAGAIMPVIPWLFAGGILATILSLVFSGLGLLATGAIITLFTGRSVLFSGGRNLLFGLAAAAVTYAIGSAIGITADI